jgi:Domain of unknown function (DUF397)
MDVISVLWRKSSHSGGNGGGCLEVGARSEGNRVLVRDTQDRTGQDRPGARVRLGRVEGVCRATEGQQLSLVCEPRPRSQPRPAVKLVPPAG